jgi:hypothetical protein
MTMNYDFNVYGDSPSTLSLTAYPLSLVMNEEGVLMPNQNYLQANQKTLKLSFPKDLKAMEYLLDDLYINNYPLTDYDDWLDIGTIPDDCPDIIKKFLLELPTNNLEMENA